MAVELFGGAVLGVVFDQLRNEIWRVKDNVAMFKSRLEELEETLGVLCPVIQEIEELNRRLNNRSDHGRETIVLRRLLEDGKELVSKCSKIPRWHLLKQSRHGEKLAVLDNKILRFHSLYMQAHMARDQKKTLLFVRQMMIMSLNQQQGDSSNLTMELTASSSIDSSDLIMSLTASSNDPFHKVQQKIVFKLHVCCDRRRHKALKLAAGCTGVNFLAIEGDEGNKMAVTGYGLDAVRLIGVLRKLCHTELLSITDA